MKQMGDTEVQKQIVKGKQSNDNYVKTCIRWGVIWDTLAGSSTEPTPPQAKVFPLDWGFPASSLAGLCFALHFKSNTSCNPFQKHTVQMSFQKEIEHAKN